MQSPMPATVPSAHAELTSATDLLKNAWEIYKAHFWNFLAISAVPSVAVMVVGGLLGGGGFLAYKLGLNKNLLVGGGLIIGIILLIGAIYLSVWGSVALLTAIKERAQNIGFKESFTRSRHLIGAFFLTSLLVGLAVFGGLILLIIPGIIFALWFSQATYIVVNEGISGTEALKKSKTYVNGRIGAVLWRGFVIFLVFFLVSFIVGMVSGIFGNDLGELINSLLQVVLAPLATIYGFLLYESLKHTATTV